jgi:hypothetical protein
VSSHQNNKYTIMNIHEIISEAGVGTAVKALSTLSKASKAAPAVAKSTAKAATKAATKTAGKATTATKATKAATNASKTTPRTSWWEDMAIKNASKIAGKEAELAKGALKSAVLKNQADEIVKYMTAAQVIKEAGVYWLKSNELDEKLANGSITPEQYKSELAKLRGVAITSIIAPKIGAWAGGKLATVTGLRLIPWLTKISGSPNAADAMKYLSSKAVQAGIIAWMGAGDGKKWLEDTFGTLLTGVGSLPELAGTAFDALKAVYQTATGTGAAAELNKARAAGEPGSEPAVDPNDPMSIMGKAVGGTFADPFKGTSRAGSTL